ncbi:MAG: PilZ domain-containing protein [Acidobacteriota bacterium]|nr:PilZ domain-containing protein [Acidobacteriota bacterium]
MDQKSAVVITRPAHVVTMRKRLLGDASHVEVFSEDSLQVFDELLAHPPRMLAIHQSFAASSRGATLVARLQSEARLKSVEVRVLIEDDDKMPLILSEMSFSPEKALFETSRPLDRAGTRQAARYPMHRRAIFVNGEGGHLIDLSVSGAQVQVLTRLRPSQVIRMILPDDSGELRSRGTVAWSIAVPEGGTIQYRAGIEFINPNAVGLSAFCARFGGAPDTKLGAV